MQKPKVLEQIRSLAMNFGAPADENEPPQYRCQRENQRNNDQCPEQGDRRPPRRIHGGRHQKVHDHAPCCGEQKCDGQRQQIEPMQGLAIRVNRRESEERPRHRTNHGE